MLSVPFSHPQAAEAFRDNGDIVGEPAPIIYPSKDRKKKKTKKRAQHAQTEGDGDGDHPGEENANGGEDDVLYDSQTRHLDSKGKKKVEKKWKDQLRLRKQQREDMELNNVEAALSRLDPSLEAEASGFLSNLFCSAEEQSALPF